MLSMNLGLKSLEKLIKGQKRPKRPTNAIQGHQRPKLQKPLILSLFNVRSSIIGNVIIRIGDFQSWIFLYSMHRILESSEESKS